MDFITFSGIYNTLIMRCANNITKKFIIPQHDK